MNDESIIEAIYSSITQDDMFPIVLELLARRFRCVGAALIYVDPGRPAAAIAAGHGPTGRPEVQDLYRREYARDDPAPAAFARLRVGDTLSTDHVFDQRFKESSRFIVEFYHPLGLRETIGGPFANDGGRFGLLGVIRGDERKPFEDDELAALARFLPHLKRAVEIRDAFFKLEARAATLEAIFDESATAVLAFDRSMTLTHANKSGRTILARADGLELDRAGRVRAKDARADARLQALFNAPRMGPSHEILRVPRSDAGLFYVVRAMPVQPGSDVALSLRVSEPDSLAGEMAVALRVALGLTEPSSRLVEALLNGESLASYGKRAGITQNTVKFHLKAAFEATGCRRQADLVRVAGTVIKDLGF
jgi:GAF domain-containing protein/DNA-binding CsgD family transcriptional regulator